jgi:hypothetical protein
MMKIFVSRAAYRNRQTDDFKAGEMDEACSTQERHEKYMQNIDWDNLRWKSLLQDLGIYWIILLKWILEK